MALTVTQYQDPSTAGRRFVVGDRRITFGTITFDSSYPTGGEAIAFSDFGFETQLDVLFVQTVNVLGNRLASYDPVNKKILLFTALGAEAANASDQSTIIVSFVAIGK